MTDLPSAPELTPRSGLDDQIAQLRRLDTAELQARYHMVVGRRVPPHLPRRLLFRIVAYRLHAPAVGPDREYCCAVAAIDLGGIGAVAALEEVAAIARIPDHAVVAGLAEDLVAAGAAGQHSVARAAEQKSGSRPKPKE
jgi:hypothetical protein